MPLFAQGAPPGPASRGRAYRVIARTAFGFRFVFPIALGSTLNPVNSSMIATALVPIAVSFHASAATTSWLIAALYLASSVAQPTMGRLADLGGARRVYLAALALVALAGILGPLAPGIAALAVVRALLGIGTSGAYPSAMRLFRVHADHAGLPAPRAALGWLSFAGMTSAVIGPTLGGVLTAAFSWRAIFLVNVPLAAVIAVLVLLWVPRDAPSTVTLRSMLRDVDPAGIAWFSATLVALLVFLLSIAHPAWFAAIAAFACGALLVRHSLRREAPFIDVRMLASNLPLSLTYVRSALMLLICYAFLYGFAQWLETGVHLSSGAAGLVMLPMSVSAAASALLGARTKGIRMPFIVSVGSALLGCAAACLVDSTSPLWLIALIGVLFGPPQGMFSTATQAAIYVLAPAQDIGTAAGLQRTAGYIGAILAMSVLGLAFAGGADDAGFHGAMLAAGALNALLFAWVLADRTIPRGPVGTHRT